MRLKTIQKRVSAFRDKVRMDRSPRELADLVHDIFYSALQNAEDTAFEKPGFTEKDYEQVALSSLEVLLAGSKEVEVQAWYRKQGFSW
jgi:hypothetical protein